MDKKINKVIIWNYISLICMAVSGLVINTIIVLFYGSEVLGIFSETYAWYLILSQISVWGIHMAIVKFVPEEEDDSKKGSILRTGILIVLISSIASTSLSEIILLFIRDLAWRRSLQIAVIGLILFSVNKVLMNYLNAISKMVEYAAFTSMRYSFFGVSICMLSITNMSSKYLPVVFPMTEVAVFICLIVFYLLKTPVSGKLDKKLIGKMLYFGTKFVPSYMVLEMNTKVDVVCLGTLCKDVDQIGLYSFAIFFTEGFYLLYVTIRRIINPDLAKANVNNRLSEHIGELKQRLRKYLAFGGIIAFVAVSIGYIVLCFIMGKAEYWIGISYILIICVSIMINGKYVILGDILAQSGLPLEESVLNIFTVASNFILNMILIISFGTIGAAVATALSYFIYTFYMKYRVKRRLGILL